LAEVINETEQKYKQTVKQSSSRSCQ